MTNRDGSLSFHGVDDSLLDAYCSVMAGSRPALEDLVEMPGHLRIQATYLNQARFYGVGCVRPPILDRPHPLVVP